MRKFAKYFLLFLVALWLLIDSSMMYQLHRKINVSSYIKDYNNLLNIQYRSSYFFSFSLFYVNIKFLDPNRENALSEAAFPFAHYRAKLKLAKNDSQIYHTEDMNYGAFLLFYLGDEQELLKALNN